MSNGRLVVDIYKSYKSESSSYGSPNGYERVSYHDGGNNYTGHGGAECSVSDIQKATSVVNAAFDDSNPGNQINALVAVLFDNIRFECSWDNINTSGKAELGKQINDINNGGSKNRLALKKMAGILEQRQNLENESTGEKVVLDWLKRQYGYPSYPLPPGYTLQKQDNTGIYYAYSPATGIGNIMPKFVQDGYLKLDETHMKLDWSNELKKYDELLKSQSQPQSIYRVGGHTFFSEQSAKKFVDDTRHPRPCDVNRTDHQFVM